MASTGIQSDITYSTVFGDLRVNIGTWASPAVSYGYLDTGLKNCYALQLQTMHNDPGLAAGAVSGAIVSGGTTFPRSGTNVPLTIQENQSGQFIAFGK